MDKKSIIVMIIAVVILALVITVFAISADIPKIEKDVILTINEEKYYASEFEKYMYINNEAAGNIAKKLSVEETDEMLGQFGQAKLYTYAANGKGITVPSGETENFKKEYASKADLFAQYGVTEADYIKNSEDTYKANTLYSNATKYYELPADIYESVLEADSGEKKTYSYRVIEMDYVENTVSGDVSGETASNASGDIVSTLTGSENADSRDAVLEKATAALGKIKGGEDFQTVAKEYMSSGLGRIKYTADYTGINFLKGDLEYAVSANLKTAVGNDVLYNAILKLNSGDCTEVVEDAENNKVYIAKVETLEDGYVGTALNEYKQGLLMASFESLILDGVKYEYNTQGIYRVMYK